MVGLPVEIVSVPKATQMNTLLSAGEATVTQQLLNDCHLSDPADHDSRSSSWSLQSSGGGETLTQSIPK